MKVSISELRAISEKLFSHLEQNGHDYVDVSHDYYWNIPEDYRYDPTQKPEELDLGQLTDDWERLQDIAHGKNEPIGHALVWLSSVLQAIGEKVIS